MSSRRTSFQTVNFSLVVCRNPLTKKWLAVDESRSRGWWLPGGAVDAGETFPIAAVRECQEEAGVKVVLRGIIRQDYQLWGSSARMRVIYYAEPEDPEDCVPKQTPDEESNGARWVTLDEFKAFPKIRGPELVEYASYLEAGGQVFPLGMFLIDPGGWEEGEADPRTCRAFQVEAGGSGSGSGSGSGGDEQEPTEAAKSKSTAETAETAAAAAAATETAVAQ